MSAATPSRRMRLSQPVDGSWLALYRMGLGACLLWQMWKFFSTDLIRSLYVEPTHHFTWFGFDFVRPWPESAMYLHFSVMAVAAACILVGFHYRFASFVFWLGSTWVFLIDQSWYLNHHYLICLLSFVGIFLPASQQWSIDAWRDPQRRSDTVPLWTLWLLRFQLGVPYFFAGVAKINADWIYGEPMRTWLSETTDFPVLGQYFTAEWCVQLFGWGGLLLDLFVVPLLLWRRSRLVTLLVVICFHLMNARLFNIGVFPWLMIWATITVFLPPATTARLLRRSPLSAQESSDASRSSVLAPAVTGLLLGYLSLQLLMPIRHWFYPGHTAFTREGHQFSWRMRLNIRGASFEFTATDSRTGETQALPLSRWLTNAQEIEMGDADHLLQLARWMEDDLRADGMSDPQITVDSLVSLNGRPPIRFVDPELDLTQQARSWRPADWIVQQPVPLYLGSSDTEAADD